MATLAFEWGSRREGWGGLEGIGNENGNGNANENETSRWRGVKEKAIREGKYKEYGFVSEKQHSKKTPPQR